MWVWGKQWGWVVYLVSDTNVGTRVCSWPNVLYRGGSLAKHQHWV